MSMIYQTATPYASYQKRGRLVHKHADNRTIREAANELKVAVVASIATIAVISWGMALSALLG